MNESSRKTPQSEKSPSWKILVVPELTGRTFAIPETLLKEGWKKPESWEKLQKHALAIFPLGEYIALTLPKSRIYAPLYDTMTMVFKKDGTVHTIQELGTEQLTNLLKDVSKIGKTYETFQKEKNPPDVLKLQGFSINCHIGIEHKLEGVHEPSAQTLSPLHVHAFAFTEQEIEQIEEDSKNYPPFSFNKKYRDNVRDPFESFVSNLDAIVPYTQEETLETLQPSHDTRYHGITFSVPIEKLETKEFAQDLIKLHNRARKVHDLIFSSIFMQEPEDINTPMKLYPKAERDKKVAEFLETYATTNETSKEFRYVQKFLKALNNIIKTREEAEKSEAFVRTFLHGTAYTLGVFHIQGEPTATVSLLLHEASTGNAVGMLGFIPKPTPFNNAWDPWVEKRRGLELWIKEKLKKG